MHGLPNRELEFATRGGFGSRLLESLIRCGFSPAPRHALDRVQAEGGDRWSRTAEGELTARKRADDAREPGLAVKYGPSNAPTPVGRPAGLKPASAVPAMVSYFLGGIARRCGLVSVAPACRASQSNIWFIYLFFAH